MRQTKTITIFGTMFPLTGGQLIRLNKDGTDGEIIQSNNTKMIFGNHILCDYQIKDVDPNFKCEISTDKYGRVS